MQKKLGIDLGCASLIVCAPGQGILLREPAVIAKDRERGKVVAVGSAAELKKNQKDRAYALSRPFSDGMMSNPETTAAVLTSVFLGAGGGSETDLLLSVPCDLTDAQEDMLVGIGTSVGARSCHLVYSPLAALAGSFLHIPDNVIAADIGAARTSVVLACDGQIRYMKTVGVGGQSFDAAIVDYLQKKRKVRVNLRTAEIIKTNIASVFAGSEEREIDVEGRDTSGKVVSVHVTSRELYEAMEHPLSELLEAIWITVSKIPTKYVRPVLDLGIQLTGGGSMLEGLDKMVSGITGVPAHRVDQPVAACAVGLAEIFKSLPDDVPLAYSNVSEMYLKRTQKQDEEGVPV